MKKKLVFFSLAAMIALSACGNQAPQDPPSNNNQGSAHQGHGDMNHSSSGEVPKGLKSATNPTYKVGNQAIMKTDHMPGMNGATATIVGAFDTTAYAVSYTPTNGGPKETNHKWVIHEEIQNAGTDPFKPGTEITVLADHMPGMNGAKATIDSAQRTTVYMVDYSPTTGGAAVKNHKWVTDSELVAK